jgi:ABC-2 type transport system ATP-binding protein
LKVSVSDGARAMLETVRVLDGAQLEPTTMALREPTLDDVFLTLTGHAAEEAAAEDEEALEEKRTPRAKKKSA